MKVYRWALMGILLSLSLSCDGLWGDHVMNNPENCVRNPPRCSAMEICSMRTQRCVPMLALNSATPGSGSTAGGIPVTLHGNGFTEQLTLDFDGMPTLIAASTPTEATFMLPQRPPGKLGAAPVLLRNPDGGMVMRSDVFFYAATMLTFATQVAYPVLDTPSRMVPGDFNGDSRIDLAIAVANQGVQILLNNRDGSFDPRPSSNAIVGGNDLAVGDLDGDGKLDAVLGGNSGNPNIFVLYGVGDCSFETPPVMVAAPGLAPYKVALADMNQDGRPDILVESIADETLRVVRNDGRTTFTLLSAKVMASDMSGLATGLFDADNIPDVATGGKFSMQIFPGRGDGTLQGPQTITSGYLNRFDLIVGDVNMDGKLDLLTFSVDRQFRTMLNKGDGTFAPGPIKDNAVPSGTTNPILHLATADLNGDGWPDLVTANGTGNLVYVYRGKGDGTFAFDKSALVGPLNLINVATFDVNGDGRIDILGLAAMDKTVNVSLNASN